MPTRRTKSRLATKDRIWGLALLLKRHDVDGTFKCSNKFRTAELNPDDEQPSQPLEVAKLNKSTLRYEVPRSSGFTSDDAIMQALVMLFLVARMKFGWGLKATCQQLSTWGQHQSLPNLWQKEMNDLVDGNKLGKNTLSHPDNYDSIAGFYASDASPNQSKWQRRSTSKIGKGHEFSEQSCIQWAQHQMEQERTDGKPCYLAELAAWIIKLICQTEKNKGQAIVVHLQKVMFEEGEMDRNEDYCKRVLNALEDTDWNVIFQ